MKSGRGSTPYKAPGARGLFSGLGRKKSQKRKANASTITSNVGGAMKKTMAKRPAVKPSTRPSKFGPAKAPGRTMSARKQRKGLTNAVLSAAAPGGLKRQLPKSVATPARSTPKRMKRPTGPKMGGRASAPARMLGGNYAEGGSVKKGGLVSKIKGALKGKPREKKVEWDGTKGDLKKDAIAADKKGGVGTRFKKDGKTYRVVKAGKYGKPAAAGGARKSSKGMKSSVKPVKRPTRKATTGSTYDEVKAQRKSSGYDEVKAQRKSPKSTRKANTKRTQDIPTKSTPPVKRAAKSTKKTFTRKESSSLSKGRQKTALKRKVATLESLTSNKDAITGSRRSNDTAKGNAKKLNYVPRASESNNPRKNGRGH